MANVSIGVFFFESLKVFFVQRHQHPIAVALRAACFVISVCLGAVLIAVVWFFLERSFFLSGAVW